MADRKGHTSTEADGDRIVDPDGNITFARIRSAYSVYLESLKATYSVLEKSCFKKCIANFENKEVSERATECEEICIGKLFEVMNLVTQFSHEYAPPNETEIGGMGGVSANSGGVSGLTSTDTPK
ncbi:hypothetical protein AAMO2058_001036000 [Amorphochlora amoebiformis]